MTGGTLCDLLPHGLDQLLISGGLQWTKRRRKIGEKVSLVGTALEETTIHLLEVHHAKGTPDVEPLLEKAKAALLNMEAVNVALAKLNAKKRQ